MSDDEYNRLLKQFAEKVRGALTWRTYFQRLVNAGRRTGRTDLEIGDDIRREYRGEIPDVTLRKSLPNSFKHQEFTNKPKAIKIIASEPEIPPPPEVHQEAEIVREPPKPIAEPSTIEVRIGAPNEPLPKSETIEVVFDPAPIDRDRTQVFIMQIDIVTKKVIKYKTVGRRSVR
jgi:hypothetical protein